MLALQLLLGFALLFIGLLLVMDRQLRRTIARLESETADSRLTSDKPTYWAALLAQVSLHPDIRTRLAWFRKVRDLQSEAASELGVDLSPEPSLSDFVQDELGNTQHDLLALELDEALLLLSEYRDLFPDFAERIERRVAEMPSLSQDDLEAKAHFQRIAGLLVNSPSNDGLDPQELQWEHREAFLHAEAHARATLEGEEALGDCHRYWALKKQYLLEHHGIAWSSPQDRLPNVRFD